MTAQPSPPSPDGTLSELPSPEPGQASPKPKRVRKPLTADQLAVALHDALGPYDIDLKKAKKLLAAGANPNATRPETLGMRALRWTPLHAIMNHIGILSGVDVAPIATLLLEAGADPMLSVFGGLPIHIAASHGHPTFIPLLAQRGFDLDIVDSNGMSALHWAGFHGEPEVARALIQAGAHIDLLDPEGRSPLLYAASSLGIRNAQTALILLAAGASPDLAALDGSTPLSAAQKAWDKDGATPSTSELATLNMAQSSKYAIEPGADRSSLGAFRALAEARALRDDIGPATAAARALPPSL